MPVSVVEDEVDELGKHVTQVVGRHGQVGNRKKDSDFSFVFALNMVNIVINGLAFRQIISPFVNLHPRVDKANVRMLMP